MNALIQVLESDNIEEFDELLAVFADVFEMDNFSKPYRAHLQNLLKKDNFSLLLQDMMIR